MRAVANGEPTYENIAETGRAAGWWQGHEAWSNLTAGGTMGLVYGAGSLWQWRLHASEPGHAGLVYRPGRGLARGARLRGLALPRHRRRASSTDFRSRAWSPTGPTPTGAAGSPCPAGSSSLYLPEGGGTGILSLDVPRPYRVFDPRSGQEVGSGRLPETVPATVDSGSRKDPRVIVFAVE